MFEFVWGHYVRIGSMFMLSSAGRNLATGLSPVQENLPDIEYKKIQKPKQQQQQEEEEEEEKGEEEGEEKGRRRRRRIIIRRISYNLIIGKQLKFSVSMVMFPYCRGLLLLQSSRSYSGNFAKPPCL